jgi:hypothetical protein
MSNLFNHNTPLVGQPSNFQKLDPSGVTCCEEDDIFVELVNFVVNTVPDPDEWTLELTLNNGTVISTLVPPNLVTASPFYTQQVQTLDATPTVVPISFPIPTNSVQSFITRVTAIEAATGDTWSHEFRGAIKNLGGTTTMVESLTDETLAEDVGAAPWSAAFTANANTLEINVTGEALHTIEWKAETLFSGVTY